MKKNLPLILVALAVVLFLFFLSSRKKVPAIPDDAVHRSATTNGACLACHSPGNRSPLKENHPPKEQCLTCHKKA